MWKSAVVVVALAFFACAFSTHLVGRSYPRSGPDQQVIGGYDAAPGQFPHQVSVQLERENNSTNTSRHFHNCGGSILNERWILTVAHCAVGVENYEDILLIVAGEHDLDVEEGTEQSVHVERIVVHPLYPDTPVVAPNDIALLKLTQPLVLNDRVKAIALPEADVVPTGSGTLSGWGNQGPLQKPAILQAAELPIIEYSQCQELYPDKPLEDTNLCTGPLEGGIAACSGDDGSPLIQENPDGSPVLIGIASWGVIPCGSVDSPSVFVRVSAFLDFINDNINT